MIKQKKLKQCILITLLIFLTQVDAKASTSQVVLKIPLRNVKFHLDTRTGSLELTCKIWSNGVRPSLKGVSILRLTPRQVRQKHLSVIVKAKNSKSFNKGDRYNCKFEADGSANGDLDYRLSKLSIQGVL